MNISVVIPCFNREARLGAAIESALGQELAPLEIVVVDDGSTDGSAVVAESFGEPVRVIRTPNRGPSAARNLGIEEARGDWIAFLDSDDVWSPEKLTRQAEALTAYPGVSLVFADTRTLISGQEDIASRFALGGVRDTAVETRGALLRFDRSLFTSLLERSRIFTSAVLVRRDLPELRFPEHFKGPEDWALWMSLALRHDFAAVDRVLVDMNYDGDNLTARYAPILGSGVDVLEELAADGSLTEPERRAVECSLSSRRVGALYHSLVEGETEQARRLLREVGGAEIGYARWLGYWVLSRLPSRLTKGLARRRLG
jgi:glycosyltransferase involved in cell wall biosynthesis